MFTAPVLTGDDPTYRGMQIPRRFWKIATWSTSTAQHAGTIDAPEVLAATGYVLDQGAELDLQRRTAAADAPPPLGAYRTFQVPIGDIAALTGLDLGPMIGVDLAPAPVTAGGVEPLTATRTGRWRRLESTRDLQV